MLFNRSLSVQEVKDLGKKSVGVRAFPTAEGFGANSVGGRGGKVIFVININDSGPGSFRDALLQKGPRIIVFKTGGIISLKKDLNIYEPFITIAGQTAPGDGVCLKNAGLVINTHDVIIRHLCSRPGDSQGRDPEDRDALKIMGGYNIILDHISASWAIDEVVSAWYSPHDITIQWSIISEALHNSIHPKGPHGMGLLIGDTVKNVSIHHNLLAHNNQRNPLLKGNTLTDILNNVIYNWGDFGTQTRIDYSKKPIYSNVINNYYKKGTNSKSGVFGFEATKNDSKIFIKGNRGDSEILIDYNDNPERYFKDFPFLVSEQPFPITNVRLDTANEAYRLVLEKAGAKIPVQDKVDARIIQNVKTGTGTIINSPSDIGGYPDYKNGISPLDFDNDGIPNEWEIAHNLNPNDKLDGNKVSVGRYTNIEQYINELAGDI